MSTSNRRVCMRNLTKVDEAKGLRIVASERIVSLSTRKKRKNNGNGCDVVYVKFKAYYQPINIFIAGAQALLMDNT
jgi:hypothetical protein